MASLKTASGVPGNDTFVPGDPLLPRMLLGKRLHDLRKEAGLTRAEAAAEIGAHETKIYRLETARSSVRRRDVIDLLTLYGLNDENEWSTLLLLADQTDAHSWWHDLRDAVPDHKGRYLSAEEAAKLVRCFDDQYVPDLLQTEAYARELHASGIAASGADRHVQLLARRQRLLRRRPRPLNLWVVLDAAVLDNVVGDADIMRDQLEHIKKVAERPNVTVQIAPYRNRLAKGPLVLARFQEQLPDIVYLEGLGAGRCARPHEIEGHWHTFNTLVTEAAQPQRTPHILDEMLAAR